MDRLDPVKQPIYSEKPVDPARQTGESALLGGEMRLTSPWVNDSED